MIVGASCDAILPGFPHFPSIAHSLLAVKCILLAIKALKQITDTIPISSTVNVKRSVTLYKLTCDAQSHNKIE